MKSIFSLGVLPIIFALLFIPTVHSQTVRVVTEGAYPPWNSIDSESGEVVGYDVDVANAICLEAKLDCEIFTQDWDSIISSIRFNKYDIIVASMTDNPNRRRVIDFSVRYAIASTQLVTLTSNTTEAKFCQSCPHELNIESARDEKQLRQSLLGSFERKKIGVQRNTVPFKYLIDDKTLSKSIDVVNFDTMGEVLDAVVEGKVNAAIGDTSYLIEYIKNNSSKPLIRVGPEIIGKTFGKGIAVGIRKSDVALKERVNAAIRTLKDSGRLTDFSVKWFSYDLAPLE